MIDLTLEVLRQNFQAAGWRGLASTYFNDKVLGPGNKTVARINEAIAGIGSESVETSFESFYYHYCDVREFIYLANALGVNLGRLCTEAQFLDAALAEQMRQLSEGLDRDWLKNLLSSTRERRGYFQAIVATSSESALRTSAGPP